ncbi:MAG: hypothetical protein M1823_003460 [Watsoniomyces obsoletus]|nr:MAG: hypothetical protein M1823_003460 [Watsoniomyces obsoletus]
MPPKQSRALGRLSSGRPPTFGKRAVSSLPSRTSRKVIRRHHNLQKERSKAVAENDLARVQTLEAEIDKNGGLETYQRASISGQLKDRGGDSSKILLDWLESSRDLAATEAPGTNTNNARPKRRMLEIGALSAHNACSRSGFFDVTRIDLHSQDPRIERQDFMDRPLPKRSSVGDDDEKEKFDIISLSLVLNYVAEPLARGEMLLRTTRFLRTSSSEEVRRSVGKEGAAEMGKESYFPSLFLVLPAPCITNSRYLNEEKLQEIMGSMGYTMIKRKQSAKLMYYLWKYDDEQRQEQYPVKKEEVNPGRKRNNFAITRN